MPQADVREFARWLTMSLIKAAWPPALVFAIHVVALLAFDVYSRLPDFDVPMHFFGGVAISYFLGGCYRVAWQAGFLGQPSRVLYPVVIVGATTLAAVVWEFAEFLTDELWGWHSQSSLADTMLDMALGLLGGIVLLGVQFSQWPGHAVGKEQTNGPAQRTAGE